MSNVPAPERPTGSSIGTLSKIASEQGVTALWRGNNANIYRSMVLIGLNVTIYDRIKHAYMPYDSSKYTGIDYYWRLCASSAMIMGITCAFTYPFDLIHTRLVSDMTKKNQQRLFTTTFDCFHRTNVDEGWKKGIYKGYELCVASSVARAAMTLPLYDAMKGEGVQNAIGSNGMLSNIYSKIGVSLASSLVLSLILYPLDTAKRCMQLNGARGHHKLYESSFDCLSKLMRTGGLPTLYRGVHLFALKELLTAFAQVSLYDAVFNVNKT